MLLRRRACVAEAKLKQFERGLTGTHQPPEARSQNGEDTLLWDILHDAEPGFFIEAGAFDGYTFSPSWAFECAGWSGLLIEPIPERAAECRSMRPRSRVAEAALTRPGDANTTTLTVVDSFQMLSYTDPTPPHDERLERAGAVTRSVSVRTATLDQLLEEHDGPIDFVVLDVEGNEQAVLEGFDLHRWQPRVLLIEDNSAGRDRSVERYLQPHGYTCAGTFFGSDLYLSKKATALGERLREHRGGGSGHLRLPSARTQL